MPNIKQSFKKGLGFGLTSGVITTLGLIVGLHAGTNSKTVVLGGILIIAISDALSDALGIHVSEESDKQLNQREIWEATISAFLSKFIVTLTFVIPVFILSLSDAIIAGIVWGLLLISFFSYFIAKQKKENPFRLVLEHVFITVLVVILSHRLGDWLAGFS